MLSIADEQQIERHNRPGRQHCQMASQGAIDEAITSYIEQEYFKTDPIGLGPPLAYVQAIYFPYEPLDAVRRWFANRGSQYRIVASCEHPDGRVQLAGGRSEFSSQSISTMSNASFVRQQRQMTPRSGNQFRHGMRSSPSCNSETLPVMDAGSNGRGGHGSRGPARDGSGGGQRAAASGRGVPSGSASGRGGPSGSTSGPMPQTYTGTRIPAANVQGRSNDRQRQRSGKGPPGPRFPFPDPGADPARAFHGSGLGSSNGAGPHPAGRYPVPSPPPSVSQIDQALKESNLRCTLCDQDYTYGTRADLELHLQSPRHLESIHEMVGGSQLGGMVQFH